MPNDWASSGFDLHLDIGPAGGRRSGLESALREAIRSGRLRPGTPLPSTRGLAKELGLSRGTVSAAYEQLAEEGYLAVRPGSGARVADVPGADLSPAVPATTPDRPPRYDLRPGLPDVSAFPVQAWLRACRRALGSAPPRIFGAGDPQGHPQLRAAVADYLGRTRGVLTTPDRVVITSGFHQSIGLLSRVLHGNGTTAVAMEDPGHNVYREVVQRAGLTTPALTVDAHGARIGSLARGIGAVVVTPSHQYPTGVPLHPDRRQSLCEWARATGGLIVEDDYDGEFRYDRQPVGALQGIAPDQVVYCGTASKTLGPALRLAWMVLPRHLVGAIVKAKEETDLYTETIGQVALAELISTHAYERHIRAARLRYRRRRELLLEHLAAFPAFTPHGVPAGLHTLVTLPPGGITEHRLLADCAERGIALRGLTELHHRPTADTPGGLLIGFAAPSEHGYPTALGALSSVLADATRRSGESARQHSRHQGEGQGQD
ncbi:PLP-dependent aminotransferase family protein [Streptomyces sp. NPDC051211]|uniref:MocR-like pyridoxine biosynthesis transcription factor PdxR n=1 Tax=Streptomyces sp. NPDC051211 TaxID=3154643 RepID=UPI00344B40A5